MNVRGERQIVDSQFEAEALGYIASTERYKSTPRAFSRKEVIPVDDLENTYTFRCAVCGFEVTVDSTELPSDYVCPVCGTGAEEFKQTME